MCSLPRSETDVRWQLLVRMALYNVQQTLTLLSLPPEVKQRILQYTISSVTRIHVCDSCSTWAVDPEYIQTAVMYTCRDLHEHARLVLYRYNTFVVNVTFATNKQSRSTWLRQIGSRNLAHISKLYLGFYWDWSSTAQKKAEVRPRHVQSLIDHVNLFSLSLVSVS